MADSKEVFQQRMLTIISDEFDKTPGSFFYDVSKPVAIELERLDAKAEGILNRGFADTATDTDLEKICGEKDVYRKPGKKSLGPVTIFGAPGAIIKKGEKVSSDNVDFLFLEDRVVPLVGNISINIECEIEGVVGNVPTGAIKSFPKTIEGLHSVSNLGAFTNGYEIEDDDALRQRYYSKVRTPATSGNSFHYLNWAMEVTGVGGARVFPLWNGNGTVMVVIINSNKRGADAALVTNTYNHIEEERPIGATVTVVSATEKAINITVQLTTDATFSLQLLEANLTNYFINLAYKGTYVSLAKIGDIIFDTTGVMDYSNLKINGGTSNISISSTEVAVLGGVTLG